MRYEEFVESRFYKLYLCMKKSKKTMLGLWIFRYHKMGKTAGQTTIQMQELWNFIY